MGTNIMFLIRLYGVVGSSPGLGLKLPQVKMTGKYNVALEKTMWLCKVYCGSAKYNVALERIMRDL